LQNRDFNGFSACLVGFMAASEVSVSEITPGPFKAAKNTPSARFALALRAGRFWRVTGSGFIWQVTR
jgi:hypothetical protein